MATYLVTGSSRGLGYSFVQILAAQPASKVSTIFATLRSEPSPALMEIVSKSDGRVVLVPLEVTDPDSIAAAVKQVQDSVAGRGLDVLINNAGINEEVPEGITAMYNLRKTLQINVEAVHDLTLALLPLLREGKQKAILNVGSIVASMALSQKYDLGGVYPSYKVSKAALHALTVQYALALEKEGFTVVAVSPGWVKTDLGGPWADLTGEESAKASLDVLLKDKKDINGKFMNIHVPGWEKTDGLHSYDGAELPW